MFPIPTEIALPERSIESLRRRVLLCEILGTTAFRLTAGQCLVAWTYLLLSRMPWLSSEALRLLIGMSKDILLKRGEWLANQYQDQVQIAFAEGRFCVWTDATCWLDLKTGETTPNLPVTPLESIAYNLAELFRRETARCRHELQAREQANDRQRGSGPTGADLGQGSVAEGHPDPPAAPDKS